MATKIVPVAGSVIQDYGSVDPDAKESITLNTVLTVSLFTTERGAAKGGGETA
jgi:hypothetical protein